MGQPLTKPYSYIFFFLLAIYSINIPLLIYLSSFNIIRRLIYYFLWGGWLSYILFSADRQTRKDLLKPLPPVPQHLDCSLRSAGIQSKCPSCPLQPINMSPLPSAPIKISLKRYAYQSTFLSSAHLICRYIYYKYVDFKVGQRRPAGKQNLQAQPLTRSCSNRTGEEGRTGKCEHRKHIVHLQENSYHRNWDTYITLAASARIKTSIPESKSTANILLNRYSYEYEWLKLPRKLCQLSQPVPNSQSQPSKQTENQSVKTTLMGTPLLWLLGRAQEGSNVYTYNTINNNRQKSSSHKWVISKYQKGGTGRGDMKCSDHEDPQY